MTPDLAATALDALAADPALADRMRLDVGLALRELGLDSWDAPAVATSVGLRRLPGGTEDRPVWMAPSDGSQCTQAGCLTREARCSSQYACSRTGPC